MSPGDISWGGRRNLVVMELSALCVLVLLPFLGPSGMGLSLCDLRPALSFAQRTQAGP